jgi:hypothetical protein
LGEKSIFQEVHYSNFATSPPDVAVILAAKLFVFSGFVQSMNIKNIFLAFPRFLGIFL